ncbi:MAG: hypothetical protein Q7K42_01365 [Candidatus Diapherotrites archaeon]|nr:hypothetical protein [Candidatus Diapherotrites archaeon]
MRKGFIFSIDAIFAISLVMVATFALYSMQFQSLTGIDQGITVMRNTTTDASWLGFYTNKNAGDLGFLSSGSPGKTQLVCDKYFKINNSGQPTQEQFCVEV